MYILVEDLSEEEKEDLLEYLEGAGTEHAVPDTIFTGDDVRYWSIRDNRLFWGDDFEEIPDGCIFFTKDGARRLREEDSE